MQNEQRIKIAIQKQGRLSNDSLDLLRACGLAFEQQGDALLRACDNFPVDILFIRDDDIPALVEDGVCQLGIVGENVLIETDRINQFSVLQRLGFGKCRLSIAVPVDSSINKIADLNNKRVATSYPAILRKFCLENNIRVEILQLAGSVEVAPRLGIADAIFDLVATGSTLKKNNLREMMCVLESEALLVTKQKQELENAIF